MGIGGKLVCKLLIGHINLIYKRFGQLFGSSVTIKNKNTHKLLKHNVANMRLSWLW